MESTQTALEEAVSHRYAPNAPLYKVHFKFLYKAGQDLEGNTFWEFKDQLNHNRLRRIVKYRGRTYHSDVQVSPLWHQWLRYTRHEPPTLQEQSADVMRQSQLKQNAMLADARWAAKAKYIESPKPQATKPAPQEAPRARTGEDPSKRKAQVKEDPWAKANETAKNPGSTWQPEAWVPGPAKR